MNNVIDRHIETLNETGRKNGLKLAAAAFIVGLISAAVLPAAEQEPSKPLADNCEQTFEATFALSQAQTTAETIAIDPSTCD